MLAGRREFNQALRGLGPWIEDQRFSRVSRASVPTWLRPLDDGTSLAIDVQRDKWNNSEWGGSFRLNYRHAVNPLGVMSRAEAEKIMSFGDSLGPADIQEAVHITNDVIGRLTIPEDLEADQRAGDDVAGDLVASLFTAIVPADFNPYDTWFRYFVREDLDRWVAFIGPRLVRDLEEQLGFPLPPRT